MRYRISIVVLTQRRLNKTNLDTGQISQEYESLDVFFVTPTDMYVFTLNKSIICICHTYVINQVYLVNPAAVRHTVKDLLPACRKPSNFMYQLPKVT